MANLEALRRRAPNLHELCRMPRFWPRIAAAVALHDLGKCSADFQGAVKRDVRPDYRHEIFSALFAPWLAAGDTEDADWIALVVLSHHRDVQIGSRCLPRPDESQASQVTGEFTRTAAAVFREQLWPLCARHGFEMPDEWSANIATEPTFSDPLALLTDRIERAEILRAELKGDAVLAGKLLRGLILLSDHSGSAHASFEFLPTTKRPADMRQALGISDSLFPHQTAAANCGGNAILIAPTGSGKTEAAMLWAAQRGAEQGGHPVVFYVLPYQASLNAMKDRLGQQFGEESISLQHSRALQSLYRQLLESCDATGGSVRQEVLQKEALRKAKFERNLAKLHVKPIRVLSPYQLLRAPYQLKGHEAIWTDAAGASFVYDEIHAYESGRMGMILATMRRTASELNSGVFVMSATLPTRLQEILAEILPDSRIISADGKTFQRFRRHRVQLLRGELLSGEVVGRIWRDAAEGKAVLVVANTVARAQTLWRALGEGAELLHGRFHLRDRLSKERLLRERVGVGGLRTGAPVVLVATQVVEVSLNVDFDVLYSDPAPLEALLQRFGRVNRKRQAETPEPKPVYVCTGIPEGCPVYHLNLVEAALAALSREDGAVLDESLVQPMIDSVYTGETGNEWERELRRAIESFETDVFSSNRPFIGDERIREAFYKMFDGREVLPERFVAEYTGMKDDPLEAELFVPITERQFYGLSRRGLLTMQNDLWVAHLPYTEAGLDLQTRPSEDGV
jgi:CRISPR-associated endonuclease/helicase Cas3